MNEIIVFLFSRVWESSGVLLSIEYHPKLNKRMVRIHYLSITLCRVPIIFNAIVYIKVYLIIAHLLLLGMAITIMSLLIMRN